MESDSSSNDRVLLEQARTAKAITDLDDLILAILKLLPRTKPWQRQLHAHLVDTDRSIQVLRMTISLDRGDVEIATAIANLHGVLRSADVWVAASRAEAGTRAALRLAAELGRSIRLVRGE